MKRAPSSDPTEPAVPPVVLVVSAPRAGYRSLLTRAGYATVVARSTPHAREVIEGDARAFDAALVDLPARDGAVTDLLTLLLQRSPLCMSLVITRPAGPKVQRRLVCCGALAELTKPLALHALLAGLEATIAATRAWRMLVRESHGPPTPTIGPASLPRSPGERFRFDLDRAVARITEIGDLSAAQRNVVHHLLLGRSDRQIADTLQMAMRTVKYHVGQVLRRTGAEGRASLLAVLLKDGG